MSNYFPCKTQLTTRQNAQWFCLGRISLYHSPLKFQNGIIEFQSLIAGGICKPCEVICDQAHMFLFFAIVLQETPHETKGTGLETKTKELNWRT